MRNGLLVHSVLLVFVIPKVQTLGTRRGGALEACVSLEASVTNVTRKWICIPAEIDKGLSINDAREKQGGIKARDTGGF